MGSPLWELPTTWGPGWGGERSELVARGSEATRYGVFGHQKPVRNFNLHQGVFVFWCLNLGVLLCLCFGSLFWVFAVGCFAFDWRGFKASLRGWRLFQATPKMHCAVHFGFRLRSLHPQSEAWNHPQKQNPEKAEKQQKLNKNKSKKNKNTKQKTKNHSVTSSLTLAGSRQRAR